MHIPQSSANRGRVATFTQLADNTIVNRVITALLMLKYFRIIPNYPIIKYVLWRDAICEFYFNYLTIFFSIRVGVEIVCIAQSTAEHRPFHYTYSKNENLLQRKDKIDNLSFLSPAYMLFIFFLFSFSHYRYIQFPNTRITSKRT